MKRVLFLLQLCLWSVNVVNAQSVTGLLGAFPPELVLLQNQMVNKTDTVIQKVHFIKGMLHGKQVVLAQTGIGKVNAAITTTLMIEHFNPREIIFSGIAGGVDTTLAAGDIVIGTQIAHHDFGTVSDSGMVAGPTRNIATTEMNPLYFNCDSNLVKVAIAAGSKLKLEKISRENGSFAPKIIKGIIVTGDVFVSSEKVTQRLLNDMHAAATEMEGAAIAQACWQQNVPFIIIRSLSDKANSKARADMMSFLKIAASNAASLVMGIVKTL
jgi:adenosylhomocysteine nucleosidase